MKKIGDNWQLIVFTMLISVLGSGCISWITKTNNAASVDYVDKKDIVIVQEFKQADKYLISEIKDKERDSRKRDDDIKDDLDEKVGKEEFSAFKDQLNTISNYIINKEK